MASKTRIIAQEKASRSSRCTRGILEIPKAPSYPRGQTPHFGIRAEDQEGKRWYWAHNETKYFLNVSINAELDLGIH